MLEVLWGSQDEQGAPAAPPASAGHRKGGTAATLLVPAPLSSSGRSLSQPRCHPQEFGYGTGLAHSLCPSG